MHRELKIDVNKDSGAETCLFGVHGSRNILSGNLAETVRRGEYVFCF